MIYIYEASDSPLMVVLDKGGHGGYPYVDVWVKDAAEADFFIEASCTGEDGTWREIKKLEVKDGGGEKMHDFTTAYRFIRVRTDSETASEIEIVAGA